MTDELAIKKQGEARTVVVLSQLQKKLDQLEKDVCILSFSSFSERFASHFRRRVHSSLLCGLTTARGAALSNSNRRFLDAGKLHIVGFRIVHQAIGR